MKSLDRKIREICSGNRSAQNFIIADAKDADMAYGIPSGGVTVDGKVCNQLDYRDKIRDVVHQSLVDIMLMSASNLEVLSKEGLFENSPITPAARGNDTTDVWCPRGSNYISYPSKPFQSASPASIRKAGADLALYSLTFNNILEQDLEMLERFKAFRKDAAENKLRYFLEVFNPNAPSRLLPKDMPFFVNDCIARTLAGVAGDERPVFLKVAYNGPKAMEELVSYDDRIIVGILGGSSGTSLDAFVLLSEAQKYGAMVALYGRKINNAQSPLHFIECLRMVADNVISPIEAVKLYHDKMNKAGMKSKTPLAKDLQLTRKTLQKYG